MDSNQVESWLSTARFKPFLEAADGDYEFASRLYDWHAEMASACFQVIHHFEVLVRNAIDGVLGDGQPQEPLRDTWLMDFGTLQPDGVKQVIIAVERLEKGKGITRGRVIAGVPSMAPPSPVRLPVRVVDAQGPDAADAPDSAIPQSRCAP